jgi:endonuclease YncB( thermonuclease family)
MVRKLLGAIFGAAFIASASIPAHAYDAVISACHDGDTCTLADGTRIRLHAIDAPELDQPYGLQAQALINRLIAGQHVDVQPTGDRSYGRIVADINLNGRSIGAEMVSAGLAWVEPRWNSDASAPRRQAAAQAAHLGLWADPAAVPPWQWRHEHGGGFNGGYAHPRHPWSYGYGWRSR